MNNVLRRDEIYVNIAIFLAALIILCIGINSMSYSSPDEKRYIQSAKEMVETGDWITPRYHGRPRFQKPILFYWLSAFSMTFLGSTWMAARLPSAFSGAATVLLTYLLGRSMFNRRTGLFSAALLLISEIFFIYSRLATPDMLTLLFITLSIYLFVKLSFDNSSRVLGYIFFMALGLAALTKGFAGLAIPLIAITIFTLARKERGLFKELNTPLGIIIFLAIVLPWFLAMHRVHGGSYINHIWRVETVNRAQSLWMGSGNIFLKPLENLIRYALITLIIYLPASLFLPGAVFNLAKERPALRQNLLVFIWIFTVIVFYSMVGAKKTHYMLAMSPAICLLLGGFFSGFTEGKAPAPLFYIPCATATLLYLFGAGSSIYLMKYLLSIETPLWSYLVIAAPLVSVVLLFKAERLKIALSFLVASTLIFIYSFGFALPALNDDNGLIKLSDKIASEMDEKDPVGIGSHFISHNRVDSYLGLNVKKVNVDLHDPAEQLSTSRAILAQFLKKDERVFCLILRRDYDDYVPKNLKPRLYVLAKEWYWKKPNQLVLNREALNAIIKKDGEAFGRLFKNEIYLVSNKP